MVKDKVLIVDDDPMSKLFLEITTKDYFKEVLSADNGLEAVELCRQNPDIAVIFMDLAMPVMDGIDAVGEIRKFNRDVVIIAQTALYEMREQSINAGCDEYIQKPISCETVNDMVNLCVGQVKKTGVR